MRRGFRHRFVVGRHEFRVVGLLHSFSYQLYASSNSTQQVSLTSKSWSIYECHFFSHENFRERFKGILNSMRQPLPGWLENWQFPPSSRIRADMLFRPFRPGFIAAKSKPLPLSTTSTKRFWCCCL